MGRGIKTLIPRAQKPCFLILRLKFSGSDSELVLCYGSCFLVMVPLEYPLAVSLCRAFVPASALFCSFCGRDLPLP